MSGGKGGWVIWDCETKGSERKSLDFVIHGESKKVELFIFDMSTVEITKESLSKYDIILLSTGHTNFDYKFLSEGRKLIVDTRNVFEKNGIINENIVKA